MREYEPPPDLEIIIADSLTLPLSALDQLAKVYPAQAGGKFRVSTEWGGPAAQGGPEIAVIIVLGELLRRGASDAYTFVKGQVKLLLGKINTRPPTRFYLNGAMGIALDSRTEALRVIFAFAEGTTIDVFDEGMREIETHGEALLAELEGKPTARAKDAPTPVVVIFRWSPDEHQWKRREGAAYT